MISGYTLPDRPKIVTFEIDMDKMLGRKNCEILFVKHKGSWQALSKLANMRSITLRQVSVLEYEKLRKMEVWFNERSI